MPRNTFQECVNQIVADCNVAIENIAASYEVFETGASLGGRIEAEDYAGGGQGVGYNDTSDGNNGNQYRTDNVDIEVSSQGGFNIGWTAAGEWLNYDVGRIYDGLYTIKISLSSGSANPGSAIVSVGDDNNALTEIATFTPERTGWQGWVDYEIKNIALSDGSDQIIRVEFPDGRVNFDYIEFTKTDGPSPATAFFKEMEYLVTELDLAQGARWRNRFSGNAARALKSRVELYAASPAYNASGVSWENAAQTAGQFIADAGGLGIVADEGLTFYRSSSNADIIWANSRSNKLSWEEANSPPSVFGRGETNPSQNLVDAFPMSNGYPITDQNSGYNANVPYSGRDNRFNQYIVYNGSNYKGNVINTYEGAEIDGINSLVTSTRTGYYLRKFMDENVNLAIGARTQTQHHYTHLRFTEVLLNYAEAANEAYGPDSDPNGYGFTARDVISALRGRAGISQPDDYLMSLASEENFRDLIRNERRIELAFEGHRFWDLRRWEEVSTIQEPIKGIFFAADQFNFEIRDIENRAYQDYMIYGPIPLDELLRYDIKQNRGW
ncbi:MAG: RagB/SusD family nutrient uptake outer membrane protein [Bacteroidota bacterium]